MCEFDNSPYGALLCRLVKVVVLPECWNSPYDTASFPVYAEPVPEPGGVAPHVEDSPSTAMLCKAAAAHKVCRSQC